MRFLARLPRHPERLLALLILPLIIAACGGDSDSTPAPTATQTDSGSIKDPILTPGPTSTSPSPTPGGGSPVNSEPFVFQSTADGATINGHLYTAQGPKRKVVILVHGESEDQADWKPLALELAQRGIATVTFDLRGHGETGGTKDISKLPADLDVAVRYLASLDWPLIYIVGSGEGGAAALRVGANQELAGVVTLSSQPVVPGLDVRSDIPGVVEPKLFMAGAGDSNGATGVITMAAGASEPKMSRIIENTNAKGIELTAVDAARQVLLNFIGNQ